MQTHETKRLGGSDGASPAGSGCTWLRFASVLRTEPLPSLARLRTKSFLILTMLVCNNVVAQQDTVFIRYAVEQFKDKPDYVTDTVLYQAISAQRFLHGTAILEWTESQQWAKNYGLYFDSVAKTPCKTSKPSETKIESVRHTDSTLNIELTIYENCCHEFLCDIGVVEDSVLNLGYVGYSQWCDCDCCFGLSFEIRKMTIEENWKKVKAVMINGNRKTMTRL